MRRLFTIHTLAAAVVLVGLSGTDSALADDARPSDDLSAQYIKQVQTDKGDYLSGKRRRLGTTEPRDTDGVVVPEPGTIALVTMGLAGLGLFRRKKK